MKKVFALLSVLVLSAPAMADVKPMTFDSIILKKDTKNQYGIVYVPNRQVEAWCLGQGSPMSVMTYEAAETMEKLEDGLFRCQGKYVQIPSDRTFPIQIFSIESCTELNPTELRAESCKPIK